MRTYSPCARAALGLSALLCLVAVSRADEANAPPEQAALSAAELLPPGTLFIAELPDPAATLDRVLNHPLIARLEALPVYEQAMANPDLAKLEAAVEYFENRLGTDWQSLVMTLTRGGVTLAFDGQSRGVVILVRSDDAELLERTREVVFEVGREEARKKGEADPYEPVEYRGQTAYKTKKGAIAVLGPWLLMANKPDLLRGIVDRYLGDDLESLSDSEQYQEALAARGPAPTLWGYVDVETLRDRGVAKHVFSGRAPHPLLEVVAGGVLEAIRTAPYVTARFDLTNDAAGLKIAMPLDPESIGEERTYYFGPEAQGHAAPLIHDDQMLFGVSVHRDLAEFWLRSGDLFDAQTGDQIAAMDSQLSTLFSGKDFGTDILGAFTPQMRIVAARQEFAEGEPVPSIKLPSFSLVLELRDPEQSQRELRRTFQSLIGFLNVVGATNGQPQLELDLVRTDDYELVTSSYIPEVGEEDSTTAPINVNFSPTIGFAGTRFVVASTTALATRLIEPADESIDATEEAVPGNTVVRVNASVLRSVLLDNRDQLIAQNMLENGHTREEAEAEVGVFMELMDAVGAVTVELHCARGELTFDLEVGLKGAGR